MLRRSDQAKDYYGILGASDGASQREIEKLYKRLAHKKHPDRGGTDEEMKSLNEAYHVLRDEQSRSEYDAKRRTRTSKVSSVKVAPASREVGIYGQSLSTFLCFAAGFMLLLLVRFNGLWFLWPLAILAIGVMLFAVLMAHSTIAHARGTLRASHPARRFRAIQEAMFWIVVGAGGYGIYLILTTI